MTILDHYTGALIPELDVETELISENGLQGIYRLYLDLANMQEGDTVELRAKKQIAGGRSAIPLETLTFTGIQANAARFEDVWTQGGGFILTYTIKQTSGTPREFFYSLLRQTDRQIPITFALTGTVDSTGTMEGAITPATISDL